MGETLRESMKTSEQSNVLMDWKYFGEFQVTFRFLLAPLPEDLQLLDRLLTSHLHLQAQFESVQDAQPSLGKCF